MKSKLTFKEVFTAGLIAVGITAAINTVLFYVFHAAGILTDDIFIQPGQPLTVVPVIIASIIPLLIGAFIFYLLERFTARGFMIFSIVATLFTLFSLSGPFTGIPGVTMPYAIVLNVMHLVAFASIMYFIRRAVQTNAYSRK
jgi:hypothetical protein